MSGMKIFGWKRTALALNKALERECMERAREKRAMQEHIRQLKLMNAVLRAEAKARTAGEIDAGSKGSACHCSIE